MTPSDAWLIRFWMPISRVIVGFLLLILGPLQVRHRGRVPQRGGLIVLANHLSDLDPPVVMTASPRHIRFMAKSELFSMRVIGPIMRFYHAFPVKRGEPDRASIRTAVEAAKAGYAVGIFPEGQLSETGKLQELKPGIALIIRMADVPVICCGLQNTNAPLPYGKTIPRPGFRRMTATWGEPRQFSKSDSPELILEWAREQLLALSGEAAGT